LQRNAFFQHKAASGGEGRIISCSEVFEKEKY
jgi:hypothetical protein